MNTQIGRSRLARLSKVLDSRSLFFFEHAGYSFDPKKETKEQGQIRCAQELARAEVTAQGEDWYCEWRDDWGIGNHKAFYGGDSAYADREPDTCECCVLFDADGKVLASLGCIDDASRNYRRVIEAELAAEAIAEMRKYGAEHNV